MSLKICSKCWSHAVNVYSLTITLIRTIQYSCVLLFQGGVCGLAVLNHPARCLCSGVMCLSWPGDFLLPEALKVITVEEDLSSAATPV